MFNAGAMTSHFRLHFCCDQWFLCLMTKHCASLCSRFKTKDQDLVCLTDFYINLLVGYLMTTSTLCCMTISEPSRNTNWVCSELQQNFVSFCCFPSCSVASPVHCVWESSFLFNLQVGTCTHGLDSVYGNIDKRAHTTFNNMVQHLSCGSNTLTWPILCVNSAKAQSSSLLNLSKSNQSRKVGTCSWSALMRVR